jgi:hypothetical protein
MTQPHVIRRPYIGRSNPIHESGLVANKQLTFRELIDCGPRVRVAQVATQPRSNQFAGNDRGAVHRREQQRSWIPVDTPSGG